MKNSKDIKGKIIEVLHKGRASKVKVNVSRAKGEIAEETNDEEDMDDLVKEVNIDHIVAELREVTEKDFKRIFLIARQYRKADTMLNRFSPEMLMGGSEND